MSDSGLVEGPGRTHSLSLVDQAYLLIKKRIITTTYAPGQSLNEQQICDEIGIGRTPVHHAVHRLARDGFLQVIPRKSVIVRPVSLDEAAHLIEVRLITEPYAAQLAARMVRRSDVEAAKRLLDEAEAQIRRPGSTEALMEIDGRFHHWITGVGQNPVLGDILMRVHDRSARFWFLSLSDVSHAERVQAEHMAILAAIASKDEARAAQATRAHIESFRNTILKVA